MLLGLETKLDYFSRDLYVMFVKSSACGANEQVKAFEKTAFQFFGFRLEDWSPAKSGFEEIGLDLPELKGGETEVQLTDPEGNRSPCLKKGWQ